MADPRDFIFNSNYQLDKIVGYKTDTITATAGVNTSVTVTTNVTETTFYDGYFSVDGSSINVPLGGKYNVSGTPDPFGNTVGLSCYMNSSGSLTVGYYNNDGSPHTITYCIYLIAKPNQSALAPINPSTGFAFNSNYNYYKIYQDSSTSVTLPSATTVGFSTATATIAHNLGYPPAYRCFVEYNNKLVQSDAALTADSIVSTAMSDNTNLYVQLFNEALVSNQASKVVTVYYRTYYDS